MPTPIEQFKDLLYHNGPERVLEWLAHALLERRKDFELAEADRPYLDFSQYKKDCEHLAITLRIISRGIQK